MNQNIHATLPAGTYYIGDPCWELILETTNDFGFNKGGGIFEINELPFICGETAYGDGEFKDNVGFKYSVDSGCLAILPIELLKLDNELTLEEVKQSYNMRIISFRVPSTCSIVNGIFYFGHIIIDTN